jgi:hypothetical protein
MADDVLEADAIYYAVYSPKNDGPECVEPVAAARSE